MWLRNIIWFILLVGIIMFSILLFLLVMDPVPDYNPSAASEQTAEIGGNQEAAVETEHPPAISKPKDTGQEEVKQQKTAEENKAETQNENKKEEQVEPAPKQSIEKTNLNEPMPSSFLYQFGQFTGYLAVVSLLFPIGLLSMTGKRQSIALRRFSAGALPFFPVSSLLALSVAMLHGGMMLRMVADWNRHLLFGTVLLFFVVLFLVRASLLFVGSGARGIRAFPIFIILILLLYVIHVVG